MNKEEFVTYEQAEALKAAGFDYDTRDCYLETYRGKGYFRKDKPYNNFLKDGHCACPTLSQAAKWLREEKNLHIQVMLNGVRTMYFVRVYVIEGNAPVYEVEGQFDDYESALSAGISKCLEIINEKRNRL